MGHTSSRVTAGLLFFIVGLISIVIAIPHTPAFADGFGYGVGMDSNIPDNYVNAFWNIGGFNAIGYPINNVHVWGSGCNQDFVGGNYHKSALMQPGCSGAVHPVIGDHWAYLENNFGGAATAIFGYPYNDSHRWGPGWAQDFSGGQVGWAIIMRGDSVGYARHVRGGVLAAYLSQGGALGWLGYPKTDEYDWPGGTRQDFVGGSIIYNYLFGASYVRNGIAEREARLIASAQSYVGQTYQANGNPWSGWCDRFVAVVAGRDHSGYVNAFWHAADLNSRGLLHVGDWNIPPGALVFFSLSSVNGYGGHVGVYIGNGQMISAKWDGVQVSAMNQNWFGTYWGWAYFNPEWG